MELYHFSSKCSYNNYVITVNHVSLKIERSLSYKELQHFSKSHDLTMVTPSMRANLVSRLTTPQGRPFYHIW